jgi:hypothetical protein
MDEHEMDVEEISKRCARCGRPAPDFNPRDPSSPRYGDPETQGWYVVTEGIVCAACATPEEMEE